MNKLILIIYIVLVLFITSCNNNPNSIPDITNKKIENNYSGKNNLSLLDNKELNIDGDIYGIFNNGNLYKKNGDKWEFVLEYYDKKSYDDLFKKIDGKVYKLAPGGSNKFLTKKFISEDFENKGHLRDLIATNNDEVKTKNWLMATLLSNKANSVAKFNKLYKCIVKNTCDFLDNRIDIVNNFSYSGKKSAKFSAFKYRGVSKASISTELMYFKKGDDLWFSSMYYIEKGMPTSIADFENNSFYMSGGPRLLFSGNYLSIELKAGEKPLYKQNLKTKFKFPKKQWVNIKVHFKFSEKEDGIIQVWQDGIKIIDTKGINLPTSNSVQDGLEIGITATSTDTIMYMDDIIISNKEEDLIK